MRKEGVKKQAMRIFNHSHLGYSAAIAVLLPGCWLFVGVARSDDTLPKGFDVGRYEQIWERNPFTLVTPSAAQGPASAFSKLILVNWLHDQGKDILFVEDTETNEVKKVTKDDSTNSDRLRLVEVVPNKNPSLIFAKLSNGREEGIVKFRFDQPQNTQVVNTGAPGARVMPGQRPITQNTGPLQNPAFAGARNPQFPGQGVNQQNVPNGPPDAQQIRRRRMLPTPLQTPVPAPQTNNQNNGAAESDDDE
jgi:hypothetical protein